jgi:hypothetical protein
VVFARPTTSPTLFAQMIGRGVRRHEGKSDFFLLDCVDDLETEADAVMRAETFCSDIPRATLPRAKERGPRLARHAYERANIVTIPEEEGGSEIAGLEIQPRQTFGVEIELTRTGFRDGVIPEDWDEVATALLRAISEHAPRAAAPSKQGTKDSALWNVEWDASCGWEITSPILRGEGGFREVVRVCRALEAAVPRLALKVDHRTGLHVHLGVRPTATLLRRTMTIAAAFEPALLSLVAPSRFNNPYCASVRRQLSRLTALSGLEAWRAAFADHESRYLAVNPRNALVSDGLGTIEVRLHSGTFEAAKILAWTSLWMRIVEGAERGVEPDVTSTRAASLSAKEDGDVGALCEVLGCGASLTEKLVVRRDEVVRRRWLRDAVHGERAAAALRSWARPTSPAVSA